MPIRIADYPDLLAELRESTHSLRVAQSAAREAFVATSLSIDALTLAAQKDFDAAIESTWKHNSATYTLIRERALARDKTRESA